MKNTVKNLKHFIYALGVLAVFPILQNCERDDICSESTPTTPRLFIEFYDVTNTDDLKNVPRLTVYGENLFENQPTTSSSTTLVFNANDNAIELPLTIGSENEIITTRYILEKDTDLRLDEDTNTNSNIDIIEISYSNEFVYISRACGYKSIFNNLDIDVDTSTDTDLWISNIIIDQTTIENEDTIHARIFH